MPYSLDGKVAVITGASKGIGEAIALEMARAGAKVVVSSRRLESVEQVAAAIRAEGGEATAVACHVGDAAARAHLVQAALEEREASPRTHFSPRRQGGRQERQENL
jgi:dehydrogenase/reductase SDR family member 4